MRITDVRVRLLERLDERLKAFCSVTLDNEFVIKDIKIIRGDKGIFVAMPSRRLFDRCTKCGAKNHLRARFCSECGGKLPEVQVPLDEEKRPKLHTDVAHPISQKCREEFQRRILKAYEAEVENAKRPGYRPVNIWNPDELDLDERPGALERLRPAPAKEAPKREFGAGIL